MLTRMTRMARMFVVTKTWNDLKPPKTIYNRLQPPQKIQQPSTTTSKTSTTIEQNVYFSPKSYSPWSLVSSTIGLTQNFHRTVLLCWEGWDISLILFPLSCETHRQFDYNLSNN